jgi:hypothetical protein
MTSKRNPRSLSFLIAELSEAIYVCSGAACITGCALMWPDQRDHSDGYRFVPVNTGRCPNIIVVSVGGAQINLIQAARDRRNRTALKCHEVGDHLPASAVRTFDFLASGQDEATGGAATRPSRDRPTWSGLAPQSAIRSQLREMFQFLECGVEVRDRSAPAD